MTIGCFECVEKVAAVGATVGVVAGAVLAIAAATRGNDEDSDWSVCCQTEVKTNFLPLSIGYWRG